MFNVLKKLLRRELGQSKYEQYAEAIRHGFKGTSMDSEQLFQNIYEQVRNKKPEEVEKMRSELQESLMDSFHISKRYLAALVTYLIAFAVLGSYTVTEVALPSIGIISILFLVKTYEYIVNKFCYVDAHMVMIYKAVLDKVKQEQSAHPVKN